LGVGFWRGGGREPRLREARARAATAGGGGAASSSTLAASRCAVRWRICDAGAPGASVSPVRRPAPARPRVGAPCGDERATPDDGWLSRASTRDSAPLSARARARLARYWYLSVAVDACGIGLCAAPAVLEREGASESKRPERGRGEGRRAGDDGGCARARGRKRRTRRVEKNQGVVIKSSMSSLGWRCARAAPCFEGFARRSRATGARPLARRPPRPSAGSAAERLRARPPKPARRAPPSSGRMSLAVWSRMGVCRGP